MQRSLFSNRQPLLILTLVLVLFIQGCGRKGPPVAPLEEALGGKTVLSLEP